MATRILHSSTTSSSQHTNLRKTICQNLLQVWEASNHIKKRRKRLKSQPPGINAIPPCFSPSCAETLKSCSHVLDMQSMLTIQRANDILLTWWWIPMICKQKGNEILEALALPFHPDTPTFLSWTIKTVTPSSELSSTESDYGKSRWIVMRLNFS